jgi:hypothetical protein
MHYGKCVSCTLCTAGQYNDKCNKWEDSLPLVKPSGKCTNCLTACSGTDEFLWHPSRVLRACDPLELQLLGKSEFNYVCKRCRTWIRKDGKMSAVIGCGNKEKFDYHTGTNVAEALSLTAHQGKHPTWTAYEDSKIDILFKPFWALRPYCPGGFFFDETVHCAPSPGTVGSSCIPILLWSSATNRTKLRAANSATTVTQRLFARTPSGFDVLETRWRTPRAVDVSPIGNLYQKPDGCQSSGGGLEAPGQLRGVQRLQLDAECARLGPRARTLAAWVVYSRRLAREQYVASSLRDLPSIGSLLPKLQGNTQQKS